MPGTLIPAPVRVNSGHGGVQSSDPVLAAQEATMTRPSATLAALTVLALLAACGGDSAREVEYTQSRGISADIAATHYRGPSSLQPGETAAGEPRGAIPWRFDDRH